MDKSQGELKRKVLSGLVWKFGERILVQLISFCVSIVLARMLAPSAFGLISLITVFITIADIIVTNGFANALIQKMDADSLDFSSVFYFSVLMSFVMYAVLFAAAPYIAAFYSNPLVTPALRVMGLRLIIGGVNSVQYAYVSRHMLFKRFFFSTLGGTIVSGVIAFIMAYKGFGVWALVEQYVVNALIDTVILWFTVRWRPKLEFSFTRMKGLFSYGWKLLVTALIGTVYNELRSLIIGRMYSPADLAFYTRGKNFPALITNNVDHSIDRVLFPAIAQNQESPEKIKNMARRSINTTAYIMTPCMFGLAIIAKPLVLLLLTEKWLECVPYLQIACIVNMLIPIQTANLQAIKAMGRSDIVLRLEIIKKAFGLAVIFLVMWHGVMAIALSTILTSFAFSLLNAQPNKKLLNYSFGEQIMDILPYIGMSLLMCVPVYLLSLIRMPLLAELAVQGLVGAGVYVMLSLLFKIESFSYIYGTIASYFKKDKNV